MGSPRPAVRVAVVMERELQPNRWEAVRHRIVEVLPMEEAFGAAPVVGPGTFMGDVIAGWRICQATATWPGSQATVSRSSSEAPARAASQRASVDLPEPELPRIAMRMVSARWR